MTQKSNNVCIRCGGPELCLENRVEPPPWLGSSDQICQYCCEEEGHQHCSSTDCKEPLCPKSDYVCVGCCGEYDHHHCAFSGCDEVFPSNKSSPGICPKCSRQLDGGSWSY